MKNIAGDCQTAGGAKPPKSVRINRQHNLTKKASFKDYSDQDIKYIQYKLNRRPREKLDFKLLKNEFFKHFV